MKTLISIGLLLLLARCTSFEYDKSSYQCDLDCHGKFHYAWTRCVCE